MIQGVSNIRNEIKSEIAKSGWTLTDIVKEMNKLHPENSTTSQNISNKLTRGTLKYSEAKEIALIIGRKIEWVSASNLDFPVTKMTTTVSNREPNYSEMEPVTIPKTRQHQYRKFTPEEAAKIDTSRLLTDTLYQVQIVEEFGAEVFNTIVEKARLENGETSADSPGE
jgi:hypothetical protein